MCTIFLMVSDGCVSRTVSLFLNSAGERRRVLFEGQLYPVYSVVRRKPRSAIKINLVGAGRTEQSRAQFSQLNARWLLFEMVAILLCEMWRMNWKRMACPDGSRPATILILSVPTSTRTGLPETVSQSSRHLSASVPSPGGIPRALGGGNALIRQTPRL